MICDGIWVNKCPACGNQSAIDGDRHLIYCCGCSLSVQDTDKDIEALIAEWNNVADNVLDQISKT